MFHQVLLLALMLGLLLTAHQKGGISAFSKTLAVEYGMEGLNVNCVCPASIETPMGNQICLKI